MKYKCLVFDHDDTTVNSTAMIHYPSFVEFMKIHKPNIHYTLEEYVKYNFHPGVLKFFTKMCGLNEKELEEEEAFWYEYSGKHVSDAFPGVKEIMELQKAQGGLIAVVSHSYREKIMRDYKHNSLPDPDIILGWEQPKEERKPSPIPIFTIMKEFSLTPSDILVIDDLKPGHDMAKAAGVKFAAACWCFDIPENEKYMKENADYVFHSVEELKKHCFD